MPRFEVIFIADPKYVHSFGEKLTEFFKKHPDAVLVSVDLKNCRALAMYEVE